MVPHFPLRFQRGHKHARNTKCFKCALLLSHESVPRHENLFTVERPQFLQECAPERLPKDFS